MPFRFFTSRTRPRGQIIHWKKNCIINDVFIYVPFFTSRTRPHGQIRQQEKTVCPGSRIVAGTLGVPFLEMPDTFNIPPTGIENTKAHGVACGFCFR